MFRQVRSSWLIFAVSAFCVVPVQAQTPSLGDLGNLFKKKSKPIPIVVNGKQTDNAIQDHGIVYVPLSVIQSVPNVAITYDANASSLSISTSGSEQPLIADNGNAQAPPLAAPHNDSTNAVTPGPLPAPNDDYLRSPGLILDPASMTIVDYDDSYDASALGHKKPLIYRQPYSRLSGVIKNTSDADSLQFAMVAVVAYDSGGKVLGTTYNLGLGGLSGSKGITEFHVNLPYQCRSYRIVSIYDHFSDPGEQQVNNVACGFSFIPAKWKLVEQVKRPDGSIQFVGGNQIAISNDYIAAVDFSVQCSPIGDTNSDGKRWMKQSSWLNAIKYGPSFHIMPHAQYVIEATALATQQNWIITIPENQDFTTIQIYTR